MRLIATQPEAVTVIRSSFTGRACKPEAYSASVVRSSGMPRFMGVKRTALHQGVGAGLFDKLRRGQVGLSEPERDQAFEPKACVGNGSNLRLRQPFDPLSGLNQVPLFSVHVCHFFDNSQQSVVHPSIERFGNGGKISVLGVERGAGSCHERPEPRRQPGSPFPCLGHSRIRSCRPLHQPELRGGCLQSPHRFSGATPSVRAAWRNRPGSGFQLPTSYALTINS